jgi:ribosome-associated protein
MIRINNNLSVPDDEIVITASRSSGPGGQNVNKVSTKVTLRFDITGTSCLTAEQKYTVLKKLKNIVNRKGCMVMHEETSRSQAVNRRRIIDKFSVTLAGALKSPKKRIATKAGPTQKKRRMDDKKIQAKKKKNRIKVVECE